MSVYVFNGFDLDEMKIEDVLIYFSLRWWFWKYFVEKCEYESLECRRLSSVFF